MFKRVERKGERKRERRERASIRHPYSKCLFSPLDKHSEALRVAHLLHWSNFLTNTNLLITTSGLSAAIFCVKQFASGEKE